MAEDGGMAFARLFSQRREELDLSVVDIAVQTGRTDRSGGRLGSG